MLLPSTETSDTELCACIGRSEYSQEAFGLLHSRYHRNLVAFAKARFPQYADDLCQEAWVRAYKFLQKSQQPMTNFRSWLFTVLQNLGIGLARGKKLSSIPERYEPEENIASPETRRIETETIQERETAMRHCQKALAEQKPEWHAVILAFVAGEKPEEAAGRLGISRDNFDQRKKRALEALQKCVESRLE